MKTFIFRTLRRLALARDWLIAQVVLMILALLRLLPADSALDFADRWARRLGPLTGRHRLALDNLRKAFPEKPEEDIQAIASDMWANMARLAAEYIFVEELFDFDPENNGAGRVEVDGIEMFKRLRDDRKPHIFFTGHIGNFELLPIAATAFELKLTALFRAPNNRYIAQRLFSTRRSNMGDLLASRTGAAFALARVLERGGNIGALVDQKFRHGVRSTFFGRECETSPLVPKLARQYDCDVHPAWCRRLPGNRFRLHLADKIELPRAADGTVDVKKTAQLLNDIVEGWVREEPGQWMWFHRRWQLSERRH